MAMMVLESFMPPRCWIAPEMPTATQTSGATIGAGLADLVVVGHVAGVHRSAAGADAGAELVGQGDDDLLELLRAAKRSPTRDDDLGAGQLRPLRLRHFRADELRQALVAGGGDVLDRGAAALRRSLAEGGAANGDDQL